MVIEKIIRKEYPIWVKRIKIEDLDLDLCSHKFREYLQNHPHPSEIFVKCNEDGSLNLRLRKKGRMEYRIYDISKHDKMIETKEVLLDIKG